MCWTRVKSFLLIDFADHPRLALAELFFVISSVLRRYDLELYDTEWERDVELTRDCFVGMPRPGSQGVRVINHGPLA